MLLAQTIGHMVYQPGETDAHGNPEDAWADPVDLRIYGYGPSTSTEPGGTQVIVGLVVLGPPDMVIDARDRFVIDGLTYEVDGEVGDWNHGPFGFKPGIAVNVKRVEGGR